MKMKFWLKALIISSLITGGTSLAYAANPNDTIVNVSNENTTEVYASLRKTDNPNLFCVNEIRLDPGNNVTMRYANLADACKKDTKFLLYVFGKTHTIAHKALLTKLPMTCRVVHKPMNIEVICL